MDAAVNIVGARLGHNIDGSTGGSPKIRTVVTAIDLKFLHIILADRQPHATAIARGLAAVDRYAVFLYHCCRRTTDRWWAFA